MLCLHGQVNRLAFRHDECSVNVSTQGFGEGWQNKMIDRYIEKINGDGLSREEMSRRYEQVARVR